MKHTHEGSRWWDRHPRAAIALVNLVLLLVVIAGAEALLRWYLPMDPGYYMAFEERPGVYRYPYGTQRYNSRGFPDDEFDLSSPKPRIGYFGDSVTHGVGAGHGYRISDWLEEAHPGAEHWTFGSTREGVDERGAELILDLADTYDLDLVVYLFNLNDILPSERHGRSGIASWLATLKSRLGWLDHLRGQSYLYSVIRSQIRLFLAARGYGYQGWQAADLLPTRHEAAIRDTAERVSDLALDLEDMGVEFLTVLIPYEMQISAEAVETYADLGIRWEPGFPGGLTQELLIEHFAPDVHHLDARQAFRGRGAGTLPSPRNRLGQYFVYDRGDALDWNDPNRDGHRRIATWLAEQNIVAAMLGDSFPLTGGSATGVH